MGGGQEAPFISSNQSQSIIFAVSQHTFLSSLVRSARLELGLSRGIPPFFTNNVIRGCLFRVGVGVKMCTNT